MSKLKKALSLTLAFVMSLALAVPTFAATEPAGPQALTAAGDDEVYDRILRALIFQPADRQAVLTLHSDFQLTGNPVILGTSDYGGQFRGETYTIQPHDVVVDLNGYSITSEVDFPIFEVQDGYTLTIRDSSAEKTGRLYMNGDIDVLVHEGGKYVSEVPPAISLKSEEPDTPPAVVVEDIPASGTASASTQSVEVDGKKVEFQMYALLDENGNGTNYVKLRDLAHVLNGTKVQFSVGYSKETGIFVISGQIYEDTGSEMNTPFSGDRAYTGGGQSLQVNGQAVEMTAINLLDDQGGGYNYFKLRDLGAVLGFKVDWSAERGVYIVTES